MVSLMFWGSPLYDQISSSIVLFLLYSSTSSEDYKAGDCITQKGCHANDKKDFPANYSYQFLRYTSVKIIITWSGAKDTRGVNQKESICATTWGKLQLRKPSLLSITSIIYTSRESTLERCTWRHPAKYGCHYFLQISGRKRRVFLSPLAFPRRHQGKRLPEFHLLLKIEQPPWSGLPITILLVPLSDSCQELGPSNENNKDIKSGNFQYTVWYEGEY